MSLTLYFLKPYGSIENFPTIDLPDFTLITGINGSGKTHLLKAISEKHIGCNAPMPLDKTQIRYFDWTSILPARGPVSTAQPSRSEVLNRVRNEFGNMRRHLIDLAADRGVPEDALHSDPVSALTLSNLTQWLSREDAQLLHSKLVSDAKTQAEHARKNQWRQGDPVTVTMETALQHNDLAALLSVRDLEKFLPLAFETVSVFQQSFARLFVEYRDRRSDNYLEQVAKEKGSSGAVPFTDEEFISRYGIPPWDFVNESFVRSGTDFQVVPPDLYRKEPYDLKLIKRSTSVPVNYTELSSGELVLMGFAHFLYYNEDKRGPLHLPTILLLDEIDAPLHPSMAKQVLRTITDTLVKTAGVKVIATTHSPTTVALAPEESLYAMSADWPGLKKTTRNQALNVLLSDVPTIALDYSGRRQVFVESPIDADLYTRIYQLIRPSLNSDRSLAFMAAGSQGDTEDRDNGSANVKRVVTVLETASNQSVFGLLDWDNKNQHTARIAILAQGERDGIENCVFDPLMLAILVVREDQRSRERIGLTAQSAPHHFRHYSLEQLQEIVDQVQALVLGTKGESAKRSCSYQGGLTLQLNLEYLAMDDHKLEAKIIELFPFLKKYKNLKKHVVTYVFEDFPEFIPSCFASVFHDILNRSA